MGRFIAIVLVILVAILAYPEAATAQPPTVASQASALHAARVKIWTGIALLSAGALLIPITAIGPNEPPREDLALASVGLAAAGSGIMYWGFRQQQKTVNPSLRAGVTFGRRNGIVIRRSW